MIRQEVVSLLEQHFPELHERFGVTRLSRFGSVARDEASEVSDVDIFADFGETPTYWQYIGALLYLEDVLGHKVDSMTEGALKPAALLEAERERLEVGFAV